jgi:signal transduction histidine kinase/CheY-like chemotaxis protein
MEALDLLAGLTGRLAAAERLDDVTEAALASVAQLGFASVWLAVYDTEAATLTTLNDLTDRTGVPRAMPVLATGDLRLPIARAFRDRKIVNIIDPEALHVLDEAGELPPDALALPRAFLDHLRGHPFACGPLLGRRGEPVGAVGLSSYHGKQPIPDVLLASGLIRVFTEHLGLALERALHRAQLDDRLRSADAELAVGARLKAVGELAAGIAHDLNNLSGIALLAIGVGQRSAADAVSVLPRIERATRAIGDLVGRLQRVARPPAAEPEVARLHEIVEDILIMTRPILRDRAIELDVEIAAVPAVRCDPAVIHQVVLNLILNAHDALADVDPDRRRLQLRVHPENGSVRLIVADSGPGIAADMLGKLFQPFATSKGSSHQGIGLAATRASLQQYGGQIEAHNAAGGGAVFEVTLVAAPAALPAVSAPRGKLATPPGGTEIALVTDRRRDKILAVDDDPDVVYIIRAYLEPLGYEVATATGPAQALEAVAAQGFDLVLCDIGMPGQSGLEMPRVLRERGYGGKLVLMTGWDSHALSADPRIAECDTLLKKPFLGTELIDAIGSLLAS